MKRTISRRFVSFARPSRATRLVLVWLAMAVCSKCGSLPPAVAASQDESLCRDCFCQGMRSKVKSTVSRNELIGDGDRLLLGVSGGFSSR